MIVRLAALLVIAGSVLFGAKAQTAAPQTVQVVDSAASLTLLDGSKTSFVHVIGYYTGSTKGGGDFIWQPSGGDAPDSCTIFSPDKAGPDVRLRLVPNALLDVTMCGAKIGSWRLPMMAAAITAAFVCGLTQRLYPDLSRRHGQGRHHGCSHRLSQCCVPLPGHECQHHRL